MATVQLRPGCLEVAPTRATWTSSTFISNCCEGNSLKSIANEMRDCVPLRSLNASRLDAFVMEMNFTPETSRDLTIRGEVAVIEVQQGDGVQELLP